MMAADWSAALHSSQLKMVITGVVTPASPVISKYLGVPRQPEQAVDTHSNTHREPQQGWTDNRTTVRELLAAESASVVEFNPSPHITAQVMQCNK